MKKTNKSRARVFKKNTDVEQFDPMVGLMRRLDQLEQHFPKVPPDLSQEVRSNHDAYLFLRGEYEQQKEKIESLAQVEASCRNMLDRILEASGKLEQSASRQKIEGAFLERHATLDLRVVSKLIQWAVDGGWSMAALYEIVKHLEPGKSHCFSAKNGKPVPDGGAGGFSQTGVIRDS